MSVSALSLILAKRTYLLCNNHSSLTPFSYKPHLSLRFVTEELGFESDEESARFICDHGGQEFLQEQESEIKLVTGPKSAALFESIRKAAFQKVDIKGQI